MSPRVNPRQWEEAARWLVYADEDLRVAEILMEVDPPIVGAAAMHCQQAAEKMAKATLVALSHDIHKTHNIEELAMLVGALDAQFGSAFAELSGISSWYVTMRYADSRSDSVSSEDDVLPRIRALRKRVGALAPESR